MPNWCFNTLTLKHDDPLMIARAKEAFGRSELLNEFIPVPKPLLETIAGSIGDEDKQKDLEIQEAYNFKDYGYKNWYDFCVNEWGTKWDVDGDVVGDDLNSLTLSFESAWAPPVAAYEKLSEQGFYVEAMYYEPGMMFCGQYSSDEGDEFYEIEETSPEWVEGNIPRDIDKMFGISDEFAQWEAEESEE